MFNFSLFQGGTRYRSWLVTRVPLLTLCAWSWCQRCCTQHIASGRTQHTRLPLFPCFCLHFLDTQKPIQTKHSCGISLFGEKHCNDNNNSKNNSDNLVYGRGSFLRSVLYGSLVSYTRVASPVRNFQAPKSETSATQSGNP